MFKKNYFRLQIVIMGLIYLLALAAFAITVLILGVKDIEWILVTKIVFFIALIVTTFILMINLRWYLVSIDNVGIKLPFKNRISWGRFESLQISGGGSLAFKTLTFKGECHEFRLKLFVFIEPQRVCEYVAQNLSWVSKDGFVGKAITFEK
ncbi:hypothetical protein [Endozoicomonas sp. ALB115]|uniref:hypothetical protein n=1 Tax=Endozoicomonas sp. ALB115 TaxID=3403074 RepID=UPI003BB534D4